MRYQLQSKFELIYHIVLSAICIYFSILLAYSLFINIINTNDAATIFMTCIVALFTLCVWSITYFSIKKTFTWSFADKNGIGLVRFCRVVTYIKWDEIVERGWGERLTLRGRKKVMYYSKDKLSERSKHNLDLLHKNTVYCTSLPENLPNNIRKHLKIKA